MLKNNPLRPTGTFAKNMRSPSPKSDANYSDFRDFHLSDLGEAGRGLGANHDHP